MGTKRRIAHRVARIIDQQPPGPFLDLFAGMCAVSTAIGQSRPIWCNDIQAFASSVARAFLTSRPLSFGSERLATLALPLFRNIAAQLRARFTDELVVVGRCLESDTPFCVSNFANANHRCYPGLPTRPNLLIGGATRRRLTPPKAANAATGPEDPSKRQLVRLAKRRDRPRP